MDVHFADLLTIALLVGLEGLLSADNAMVLAVLVLGLPWSSQRKALRYGIVGAFALRAAAVAAAYPALVDGAFIIITWVGLKLLLEYGHAIGVVSFEVPRWFSLALIVVIFVSAYVYARRQGPVEALEPVPVDISELPPEN